MAVRIGTAGWSIPSACADRLPGAGSHLQRYASQLNCAEINSSFHRPHRPSTYARWAESVPADFRFSVKLPKAITHGQRLAGIEALLQTFATEIAGLGNKRGPLLVQLPPSLVFDPNTVEHFFDAAQALLGGQMVIEPRHASWYTPDVDAMLVSRQIARVAADPPVPGAAAAPGGWPELIYYRLHGSPAVYRSSYDEVALAAQAQRIADSTADIWTIYDNTASGAALGNALDLINRLSASTSR